MKTLAELRAETSLTKQEMSNDFKEQQDRMKQKDVKNLERPKKIVYKLIRRKIWQKQK